MKFEHDLSLHCMHTMHGMVENKEIRFSEKLKIDIFKFIFGMSFKIQAIQAQTRTCSDKDFLNLPTSNLFKKKKKKKKKKQLVRFRF